MWSSIRGKAPLRYQVEIVPRSVEGVPPGIEEVSIVWERGSKLSLTRAERVDARGCASFREVMRQSATVFRQDNKFEPKEYSFKLQAVTFTARGQERRKTVAKTKLDLSHYCSSGRRPEVQTLALALQPEGALHLQITTTWLQNVKVEEDGGSGGDPSDATSGVASQGDGGDGGSSAYGDDAHALACPTPPTPLSGGLLSSLPSRHRRARSALPDVAEADGEGASPARRGAPPATGAAASKADVVPLAGSGGSASSSNGGASSSGGGGPPHRAASAAGNALDLRSASSAALPVSVPAGRVLSTASLPAAAPPHAGDGRAAASPQAGDAAGGTLLQESLRMLGSDGEEEEGEGGEAGGAGIMGRWLRSFAPPRRDAPAGSKGASSEELLRDIDGASDMAALQALARTLLAERNDWRLRCSQAEREAAALGHSVRLSESQRAGLVQRLAAVESLLAQAQESALLDKLVEAKLHLAQSDLTVQDLKGQLTREKVRARTMAARLTTAEARVDTLLEEKAAAVQELGDARRAVGLPATPGARAAAGGAAAATAPGAPARSSDGGNAGVVEAWDGLVARTARALQGGLGSLPAVAVSGRHSVP